MKTAPECPSPCGLDPAHPPNRTLFEVVARWWPAELFLLLAMPALMWALAGVVSYQMPTLYESSALIEIKPPATEPALVRQDAAMPAMSPEFMATEAEIMLAGDCLQRAAAKLDLANQWNLPDGGAVLRRMKQQLKVAVLPNTHLIRITARNRNPIDARDLAAEVARAYREMRMEDDQLAKHLQLEELKRSIRSQEDTLEQSRKLLGTIVKAKQIVEDGSNPSAMTDDLGLHALLTHRTELEQLKITVESQLKGLEKNPLEQLLAYHKNGSQASDLHSAYLRLTENQRLLDQLKSASPPADAAAETALRKDLEFLQHRLDYGVALLKATLRGELDLTKTKLEAVRSQLADVTQQMVSDSGNRVDYLDAKMNHQLEADQLQRMKRQLIEWEFRNPGETILMREDPVAAERPASPDIRRNLALATVGGFLAALLLILPLALLLEGFSSNRRTKRAAAAATPPPLAS